MGASRPSPTTDEVPTRAGRLRAFAAAPRPMITPSLLNCDFARMAEVLERLERLGVAGVHLDVMDGRFVPNLSYGPPVIADWRRRSSLTFDTHLMMDEPWRLLDAFVRAGSDVIVFHVETVTDPKALADRIHAAGCEAGIALNPETPAAAVEPHLDAVDAVLVMSVNPGFGGQAFQPAALEKVRRLRALRPDLRIAIDGGINAETIGSAVAAGATQLVAGSAVFRADGNDAAALAELAEAARRGSA